MHTPLWQVPAVHASLHAVPADLNVQLAAQHDVAVPFATPSSHCSPASTTLLPHVT